MNPQAGRTLQDLSSKFFMCGKINQLQTLKTIPVVAGDSIALKVQSVMQTAPLRRRLYMDMKVEYFGFFIPDRHIFGADWLAFVKAGANESTTFGTRTMSGEINCLGTKIAAGTVYKPYPEGYVNIFNRFFAHPSYPTMNMATNYFDGLTAENSAALYGATVCWLPRAWNTPVPALVAATDKRIALVDTDKIDLVEFAQKQGHLESIRGREFFASTRYVDVLGNMFGSTVGIDADQRPELLFHVPDWLTSFEKDGTDDATLGRSVSKAEGSYAINMPWKFFAEHGILWIMALVRFEPVHVNERHPLAKASHAEPTWKWRGAEPSLWEKEPPEVLDVAEWIEGATQSNAGLVPYGQHYREDANHVHARYRAIEGHPFIEEGIASQGRVYAPSADEFDNVFDQPEELGHWQMQGKCTCMARRVVPPANKTIFAGAR